VKTPEELFVHMATAFQVGAAGSRARRTRILFWFPRFGFFWAALLLKQSQSKTSNDRNERRRVGCVSLFYRFFPLSVGQTIRT